MQFCLPLIAATASAGTPSQFPLSRPPHPIPAAGAGRAAGRPQPGPFIFLSLLSRNGRDHRRVPLSQRHLRSPDRFCPGQLGWSKTHPAVDANAARLGDAGGRPPLSAADAGPACRGPAFRPGLSDRRGRIGRGRRPPGGQARGGMRNGNVPRRSPHPLEVFPCVQ
jgi:hypothetical protein